MLRKRVRYVPEHPYTYYTVIKKKLSFVKANFLSREDAHDTTFNMNERWQNILFLWITNLFVSKYLSASICTKIGLFFWLSSCNFVCFWFLWFLHILVSLIGIPYESKLRKNTIPGTLWFKKNEHKTDEIICVLKSKNGNIVHSDSF